MIRNLLCICWCLAVGLVGPSGPVLANPIADVICEPTERMHIKMTEQMRSQKAAVGLRGREQIVEIWTDARGDWAMVIAYATGKSCIVAMGEDWQPLTQRDPA